MISGFIEKMQNQTPTVLWQRLIKRRLLMIENMNNKMIIGNTEALVYQS